MLIYGLMKYIERIPLRYDWMMNLLTLGALDQGHRRLLAEVRDGMRVLDVGCGTGLFAVEAARRGARVTAVDANPQMLTVLRGKIRGTPWEERVQLVECGSAGIGRRLAGETFDLVVASMMLGELPMSVRRGTLQAVTGLLAPGGRFLVSDELWPDTPAKSAIYHFLWWLFFIPNFILTRTLITPVEGLPAEIERSGMSIIRRESIPGSVVTILTAVNRHP